MLTHRQHVAVEIQGMQVDEAAQSRDRQFLDLIALGRQFREHR